MTAKDGDDYEEEDKGNDDEEDEDDDDNEDDEEEEEGDDDDEDEGDDDDEEEGDDDDEENEENNMVNDNHDNSDKGSVEESVDQSDGAEIGTEDDQVHKENTEISVVTQDGKQICKQPDAVMVHEAVPEKMFNSKKKPNIKSTIQYELTNGTITKSRVLSRQPKKGTKYENWINVQIIGKDDPSSVNCDDIVWWREVENNTEEVLVLTAVQECEQKIVNAKQVELQSLIDHNVFDWVENTGQKAVSAKWILHSKEISDGTKKVKARLVARGFEEKLADKRVESPTCSRQRLRLTFAIAASMEWELHAMDISSAFLQGNELQRTVYVRPPTDIANGDRLWKLKRCLYGLSDAPREWYDRVCEEMKKLGGKVSVYDQSVFMWHGEGSLIGLVTTHVDDFEYCGTSTWLTNVFNKFLKMFRISKNEKGTFKYIGLNIEQNGNEIFVDQHGYVDALKEIKICDERIRCPDEILTEKEKMDLRSICGQLLWATSQTRPDAAFESCRVNNYGSEPTIKNILEANRAVKKLQNEKVKIVYPCLGDPGTMKIVVYGDGSHASLPNGASHGGKIVFLSGNGRSAPIAWQSKKLDRVTKSPLATEVSAVADAADMGFLVASMVKETFALDKLPGIDIVTDSKSLKEHLETKTVINDPRNRVDTARLREMTDIGEVTWEWVPSERMLADCLTKQGASSHALRKALQKGVLPHPY